MVRAFFLSETVSGIPTRLVCLTSSNNNSGSVRNINREDHGLQFARERRGSFRPPDGSASLTAFQSSVMMHIHRGPDLMSRKLWRVSLGRHFLRNQLLPSPGEPSILSSLRSLLCWYLTFYFIVSQDTKGCPRPMGTLVSCSLVGKGGPQKKTPEVTQDLRLVHDISDIITEYHKKVPI